MLADPLIEISRIQHRAMRLPLIDRLDALERLLDQPMREDDRQRFVAEREALTRFPGTDAP